MILRCFQMPLLLLVLVFCFHRTYDVFLLAGLYIFSLSGFFFGHISVCWNCNIYEDTCSFYTVTNCDVWLICYLFSSSSWFHYPQMFIWFFSWLLVVSSLAKPSDSS
jgi:hypothetical protein